MHRCALAPYENIQFTQSIQVASSLHPEPFAEISLISFVVSFCIRLLLLFVLPDHRQVNYTYVIGKFAAGPVTNNSSMKGVLDMARLSSTLSERQDTNPHVKGIPMTADSPNGSIIADRGVSAGHSLHLL